MGSILDYYGKKTAVPLKTSTPAATTNATTNAPMTPTPTNSNATAKPVVPMLADVAARDTANGQQTAQAWINNPNSGFNGLDSYVAKQNERYAGALSSGDTDLSNKLTADSQRVGYTLNAPQPMPATPKEVAQPNQGFQPPDYAALAASRTAAALANKRSIAEQQKSSLDRSYARSNQITQDNRTLENGQIDRTLNPFSGKTGYDKGIIGRERTLADESSQNNLNAQKANIDQLLADYENATADEQVRIADELQRADRDYQLALSDKTGTMANGQRTLAGQQFDYNTNPNNPQNQGQVLQNQGQTIQNQLAQYQLADYPAEAKAKATMLEQQVKSGALSNEAAQYNLQQLKDPTSPANQAQKLDLQMKQLEASNLPEKQRLELQQLKRQIAEIGVVHYKPQTATEIEMDNVNLQAAKAKLAELQNPTSKPKTTDYKTNPEFSSDVAHLKSNPDDANLLDTSPQPFIDKYGYDGYLALRKAAGLD